MNRKINITNTCEESTNRLQKVALFPEESKTTYLPTYAENVFPAGREALTTGKFHDMFMAGDGHELEDYTDKNGRLHPAHARAINSSSMLAYNFFHWVNPEHPLKLYGSTFDKVYFEVKFPVMASTSEGRPVNRPSNMDVVLVSDDCTTMLCVESKYTEHTHKQQAIFSDAYFKPECYYEGNPYRTEFIKLALRYNEESNGYYAGIKQNISHLIGLTNIMHDANALAWFKANNPFIEPEVMERLSAHTQIIFTNLLYTRPEMQGHIYGENIPPHEGEEKVYPYLLGEVIFDHLWHSMDEPLLLSRFIETYPHLFEEVKSQMPSHLADYLDDRYVLTIPPKFPLPKGYDTADHYLIDLVLQGANERYKESFTPEVTERIKSELAVIRHRGWADRFLIAWDCVRAAREELDVYVGPGRSSTAGSIVAYCLKITNMDPLKYGLLYERFFNEESIGHPKIDIDVEEDDRDKVVDYLRRKYGEAYVPTCEADKGQVQVYPCCMLFPLCALTVIKDCVHQIKNTRGLDLDIDHIPVDDELTFQLFREGRTEDVFQFQSEGVRQILRELQPTVFEDLIALNTLYRPGLMDYIPQFIRRKLGQEAVTYDIPVLETYQAETYGLTIYQEQIMRLSCLLANFTRNESDALRKALCRKQIAVLASFKDQFLNGGRLNGYSTDSLDRIWNDWVNIASYAFNKSHAVCYTWLAYQTAYLKAHYPEEFRKTTLRFNQNCAKFENL